MILRGFMTMSYIYASKQVMSFLECQFTPKLEICHFDKIDTLYRCTSDEIIKHWWVLAILRVCHFDKIDMLKIYMFDEIIEHQIITLVGTNHF